MLLRLAILAVIGTLLFPAWMIAACCPRQQTPESHGCCHRDACVRRCASDDSQPALLLASELPSANPASGSLLAPAPDSPIARDSRFGRAPQRHLYLEHCVLRL